MARASYVEHIKAPMHYPSVADRVMDLIAKRYPQPFTTEDARALVEKACGRYTRGAHVGQLRGWVTVTTVSRGGWAKDGPGYGNGHVVRPGQVVSIVITDYKGRVLLEVR